MNMTKFDVTVAQYPAKRLIGMKVQTTMAKAAADCPVLWDSFGPKMGELCAAGSATAGSFGVCVMLNAEDFDYWAAVEVGKSTTVPQGLGSLDLPAGLYAKAVVPNLEKLGEAFTYLFTEWNKDQADYACDETVPCFEFYPQDWQPSGAFEILVAVKKL
jgi:AraC family transcriptional regulator